MGPGLPTPASRGEAEVGRALGGAGALQRAPQAVVATPPSPAVHVQAHCASQRGTHLGLFLPFFPSSGPPTPRLHADCAFTQMHEKHACGRHVERPADAPGRVTAQTSAVWPPRVPSVVPALSARRTPEQLLCIPSGIPDAASSLPRHLEGTSYPSLAQVEPEAHPEWSLCL